MTKHEQIRQVADQSLEELLGNIALVFGDRAAFSTSLSWEDQVITDVIFRLDLPIRVFTLDTSRLFSETYSVLNSTLERYKKRIEVYSPQTEAVQQLMTEKGPVSFYESLENRKECCFIRKVEPLNRALQNVECWITGLRAEHSENRQDLPVVDWDEQRGITKVNPLSAWSLDQVKERIRTNNIPYNTLHDRGFVSIGCQPCTRAIREGDNFRAGRWWWEDNSKKECGLHV
ncbi:MAG: phosphoadenosine phosphosulfate reductase [Candidatus Fluviicola riflensis]|nr:MAG: phosphoadenosine phosphosulfate reductase [Candidatus Fluviicola riflensis]OGS79874.1 MAG: phosphoadenosine phosphosulfate reductase [Candidatus Fluviicola riflensis]OGS82389.1 MAG: phosphoadenosine phosphosulfate reductase [Fluviicola sp. RIFCSPHIGHO2_01_FULL_43_53]OGS88053.1 MAG: phosphoadenosine phosphosulfate reductase [Fluviicola sp. RIFCSPHIGHO2_12_FULL_43_24]